MTRSSVRMTSAATQRQPKPEPEPEPAVNRFIKIILLPTIEKKMMQVPARFVRLGPKLSNIVILETPMGYKCSIGIKRIGDEVWFENGWNEFVETHSIGEGYLLCFDYKENSSFDVVIFNLSASEIDYPVAKLDIIESDDDDNKEVMDDDDTSEEMIDSDEFLRKIPTVNVKYEEVIILDD